MVFIIYAERPLQYRSFPHSCDLFNLYPSSTDLDKSLAPDSFSPWKAHTKAHLRFCLTPQKKKKSTSPSTKLVKKFKVEKINACLGFGLWGVFLFVCLFWVYFVLYCMIILQL